MTEGLITHYNPATYYEHTLWKNLNHLSNKEMLQDGDLIEKKSLVTWVIDHWHQLTFDRSLINIPVLLETEQVIMINNQNGFALLTPRESPPYYWSKIFSPNELSKFNILHEIYKNLSGDNLESHNSYLKISDMPAPKKVEHKAISDIGGQYCEYDKEINRNFFWNNTKFASTIEKHANLSLLPEIFWSLSLEPGATKDNFIRWVLVNLENNSQKFKHDTFFRFYRKKRLEILDSPCWFYLKRSAWLKTTHGYRKPSECFINDANIRHILGDSVPYLIDKLPQLLIDELEIIKRSQY